MANLRSPNPHDRNLAVHRLPLLVLSLLPMAATAHPGHSSGACSVGSPSADLDFSECSVLLRHRKNNRSKPGDVKVRPGDFGGGDARVADRVTVVRGEEPRIRRVERSLSAFRAGLYIDGEDALEALVPQRGPGLLDKWEAAGELSGFDSKTFAKNCCMVTACRACQKSSR